MQTSIKQFGNAFDKDSIQLIFPKKVNLKYVGIVVGGVDSNAGTNKTTDTYDITSSVLQKIENESVIKEFKVKIDFGDKKNGKKVLVNWQFERGLDFRLSEVFIN